MISTSGSAPTVALTNLGCKVNISEGESLAARFRASGFAIVDGDETAADVYVINSCTVTSTADHKSRQSIRQALRANPLAIVAATGCYISVAGRDFAHQFPGNVLIVHNRDKDALVERVEQALLERGSCINLATQEVHRPRSLPTFTVVESPHDPTPEAAGWLPETPLQPAAVAMEGGRTRAFLKVQDGCNAGCSFCIIPRARGGPRSVPVGAAIQAAQRLEEQGFKELVLSGILLGSYGHDLPGQTDLGDLLRRLLAETGIPRLRISSIEPQDVAPRWLDLWSDPRMCRHLHLPLQSGSATTLRAMRRKYDPDYYAALVDAARHKIPDLALTADVMVGFPGETEEVFAESAAFIQAMEYSDLHIFKYSPRPGTAAYRMPETVDEQTKRRRSHLLHEIACEGRETYARRFIGQTVDVLWEMDRLEAHSGLTDTYLRVQAPLHVSAARPRQITPCLVQSVDAGGAIVWGTPIHPTTDTSSCCNPQSAELLS